MDTSIFTRKGKYLMLALDHRGSFRKMINPENPDAVGDEEAIALKARIIEPLKDQFSGILIDPTYGLPAYKKVFEVKLQTSPYLLSIEESGYSEEKGDRYSKLQYKAAQLKAWGAFGVKLLLYFDPQGKSAEYQMSVAKETLQDAHSQNLPLFLEIVTYGKGRDSSSAGQSTLEAMRMLLAKGVKPDVWKLEFPGSAELCRQITELAPYKSPQDSTGLVGKTPWILLTRGASFEQFKKELQTSVENGAVGFLAGRAVWQEVMEYRGAAQEKFLFETVPSRFAEISTIALQN